MRKYILNNGQKVMKNIKTRTQQQSLMLTVPKSCINKIEPRRQQQNILQFNYVAIILCPNELLNPFDTL